MCKMAKQMDYSVRAPLWSSQPSHLPKFVSGFCFSFVLALTLALALARTGIWW